MFHRYSAKRNSFIANGAYGSVYCCILKKSGEEEGKTILLNRSIDVHLVYALKVIQPKYGYIIFREILCEEVCGFDRYVASGFEPDSGAFVIVQRLAEGDLHDLPCPDALGLLRKLVVDLARLARFGFIHRDIHPGNILYGTWNHEYTLADFGCAIHIGLQCHMEKVLTETVTVCTYRSPEVLRHEMYGEKTDIWSLGCVFFEALCRQYKQTYPLPTTNDEEKMLDAIMTTIQTMDQHAKCFTEQEQRILAGCLQINPGLRWSLAKLHSELTGVSGTSVSTTTQQIPFSLDVLEIIMDGSVDEHTVEQRDNFFRQLPLVVERFRNDLLFPPIKYRDPDTGSFF